MRSSWVGRPAKMGVWSPEELDETGGVTPRAFGGSVALPIAGFGLPAPGTVRTKLRWL